MLQLELLHDSKGAAENEHYFQHFAAHLGMDGQVRSGGVSRTLDHRRTHDANLVLKLQQRRGRMKPPAGVVGGRRGMGKRTNGLVICDGTALSLLPEYLMELRGMALILDDGI